MSKPIDVLAAITSEEAWSAVCDLIDAVDNAIDEWEKGHDSLGPMDYLKHIRSNIIGSSK